jgi:hypothetical protein
MGRNVFWRNLRFRQQCRGYPWHMLDMRTTFGKLLMLLMKWNRLNENKPFWSRTDVEEEVKVGVVTFGPCGSKKPSLPVSVSDTVDDKSINLKLMISRSTSYGVCYETRLPHWSKLFVQHYSHDLVMCCNICDASLSLSAFKRLQQLSYSTFLPNKNSNI